MAAFMGRRSGAEATGAASAPTCLLHQGELPSADDRTVYAKLVQVDTGSRLDGPSEQLICDLRNNCP